MSRKNCKKEIINRKKELSKNYQQKLSAKLQEQQFTKKNC